MCLGRSGVPGGSCTVLSLPLLALLLAVLSNSGAGAASGPQNVTEVFALVGAQFQLDVSGPGLSTKDRVVVRDSGNGCPGRSAAASSLERRHSISLASSVCWGQGLCEPSPVFVFQDDSRSGRPVLSREATNSGGLKVGWYPLQFRSRGAFRVCYCTASNEPALSGDPSPCDLDGALYSLAAVVYSQAIEYSPEDITPCAVDDEGGILPGCTVTISSDRGGLSMDDKAQLMPDVPGEICGEAPTIGGPLQPLTGDALKRRWSVPIGAPAGALPHSFATLELPGQPARRFLKVCYCEKSAISRWDKLCAAADWQHAGRIELVGFAGHATGGGAVPRATCYRGRTCRIGRLDGFGLDASDTAIAVPNVTNCSGLDGDLGFPVGVSILGNTVATQVAVTGPGISELETAVCYCPAAVNGYFGCKGGQGRMFPMLMGYVRLAGLKTFLSAECLPTARSCPQGGAGQLLLGEEDAEAANAGQLFVVVIGQRSPCDDVVGSEAMPAQLVQESNKSRIEVLLPWPLTPDQYALCYCDNAQGCPSRGGQQRFTLQHAGNLSVPGAVRGVQLLGDVGFATAVLKVELSGEATGIQCCANAVAARVPSGSSRSCAEVLAKDLPAQATFEGCLANGTGCRRMLPYPRSYNLTLALQEARVHRAPVELNISCAALGELDECAAAENATCWPCEVPAGGLRLELPALPASWVGPWRRAVGSSVGAESLAKPAGLNVLMKVVSLASGPEEGSKACNGSADAAVEGLPCQEVACMDDFLARAITPGTYKLCICEPIAVTTPGACQAWYGLGGLDIFGPVPMTAGLLGAAGVAISFELQGFGFSGQDRLASVLSAATGQSACQRSDGLGAVAAQSTVHSPLDWKVNSLSFQIVLGEGMHSLCWLPPGGTPFFVGTAEVAGAASSPGGCAVGPWAKAGNCSASCGAGGELWRRQVLSGSAGCPALNDTRLCFGPPCTSSVSAWHASPEQPRAGAAVKLYISGSDLPAGLRGMLMPAGSDVALRRLQAPDATRSEAQGACLAGGEVAAAAICSGDDSNQVCGFEHCPASAGSYQVCLCVVWDGSKCTGFLPALGQVSVLNPLGTAEDETNGLVVAVVVVAVLFLLGCSVGAMVARLGRVRLLQMCGLRTKVGKVILEGQNGKDAAKPPAAQEQNSEELRGLGSGEPESEPPGETTPRPDPSEEQSGATLPQARAGRDEDDEKEEEEEAGNLEVALPVPPTPPATPPGTGGPPGCVLPAGSNVHLEESSSLEEGQRSRQGSKASNNNSNSSSSNSKSHRSRQGSKGKLRHEARNASRDCVPCPPAPPPPLGAFPMLPMKLPLLPSQLKNDEALSAQRRSLPRTLAPPPRAPLAPPWRSPGGATKVTSEEEAMAKALAVLDAAKQKVREQDEERCGKPACSQSKEEEPEFVADRQGPGQEKDIDKASTLENVPGHLGLSSAEEADEDEQHERQQQQRQQQQQEQQQQEQQQHEHQQHARSRAEEKEPDRLQELEEQEKQLGRTGIEEEKERRRLQAREEEREQRSLRELEEQNKRAHFRSLEEQQEQQRLREMEEKENERARLQSLEEQEERRRLRELEEEEEDERARLQSLEEEQGQQRLEEMEEEENERARLQSLEEQQGQQRLREMEEEENERARLQSLEEEEERRRLREMEEEEEENERARLQRLEEHQGQQRLREMEEEENERARRQSLEEEQGQQRHREMEEEGNERARLQSLEEQQGQQHLREMEEENERARLQSLEKQQGQQHFRELEEENEQHCLQAQKDQKHPLHHRETEELQERRALEMLEDDKKERCREIEEQKEQQCPHPLEAEEEKQQVESIEKEPEHVSVFGVEEQLNFSQTPEAREHQLFTALQEKKERELQQALEEARQQRLRALEEGKGPEDLQALEESQRQRFQALSEDLQRLIALQDQVGRERLQALDVQGQQRLRALEKEKGRERLQALQQKQHQQHSLALEEESERDLLEAHEAKERQSLAALQDEKERELLQALEEARQQRLRALEEGKGPEDLQALEESQRQRLQALDEELQRLIALQDQIERERLQALREEKKQQQFPKSLEVQKEEERPIAVEAELEEQSRLEQLGALEAALEQERLLVAQEEERLRAEQEEQRRAEEAERELELARQREAWEQACLEADDKEEEREHWRRLAEERERFCRQGQQEGRRQLHQQQLKEQRLQQLQQKQLQVLQPRRSAGDNDDNNFNDNFHHNDNNNRRSAGADSQTTSQAGMPATCTPPPRTSAVKKARDRSITPPPPQHRSGGLSGGSASAASGSGGQHQALDQETAEWAEFARKRRDRPSSRGSADALLPGGARMSIATSDGQSERAGMAFALGQLDMLDFDVRKRVSGTDSKDKKGSQEQTRADLRGKALVDGGTLMLWKSSKAVAEPSGRPSSAKPRPA